MEYRIRILEKALRIPEADLTGKSEQELKDYYARLRAMRMNQVQERCYG